MKVVIGGAGPAGLLMAINLLQRKNYHVMVCEKRPDMKGLTGKDLRTFPVSMQKRSLDALGNDELLAALEGRGQRMDTIMVHSAKISEPRAIKNSPALSVDRNDIACVLLEHLREKTTPGEGSKLEIKFDTCIEDLDLEKKKISGTAKDGKTFSTNFDRLVAADGATSRIRHILGGKDEITFEQKPIVDSYKSLYINLESNDGSAKLREGALHGWMMGENRIISAHVKDDYCSGVFIFPTGKNPFENMETAEEVQAYLNELAPDLARFVPEEEARKLLERPVASQWTVEADRLHVRDCVLLLGDAAHAVSAASGQGCNSALEDVKLFTEILDNANDDWEKALPAFTEERLPDAHAVKVISDYSTPRTALMRVEWIVRLVLGKILPSFLKRWFLRPMPMELLSDGKRYRDVLEQTKWWIGRVRRSMKPQEESKIIKIDWE